VIGQVQGIQLRVIELIHVASGVLNEVGGVNPTRRVDVNGWDLVLGTDHEQSTLTRMTAHDPLARTL